MKTILLTFDVEEFDLPRENGFGLGEEEEFEVSKRGLISLVSLLDRHNIKATFFTTANFAQKYPQLIKKFSEEGHEIASHGYIHSDISQSRDQIKKAKEIKERIIGKKITGFRAPRFNIKNIGDLESLGFEYDSSLHPIFIPGRYNNLFKPRKIHKIGDIMEIPPSTSPLLRLPIFWLVFKNFPLSYSKFVTKTNFLDSSYTMLLLHPWEFTDLEGTDLPWIIKRKYGKSLLNKLERYILWGEKKGYSFETISDYLAKSFK